MKNRQDTMIRLSAWMMISHAPEAVFPLLCPVREYDWIPHWQCELIHTEANKAEEGCVFRTDFRDHVPYLGPETWLITRHERNKRVHFAVSSTHLMKHYRITLSSKGTATRLLWEQDWIALDDEGQKICTQYDPGTFIQMIGKLEHMLEHYVTTGKRLS